MKKAFIALALVVVVVVVGLVLYTATHAPAQTPSTQNVYQDPIIGNNLSLGTDGNDKLGTYLIGYNGRPVYTYAKDWGIESTCYDSCATLWLPYIVSPQDDVTHLQEGVSGIVGIVAREDSGSLQLSYNGHPLYFYAQDQNGVAPAGETTDWKVARP